MKKIVFLASGNGGTMKFLHQASIELQLDFSICGVISDRYCGSVTYSKDNSIPTYVFDNWRNQEVEIISTIRELNPDVVITNIFKILSPSLFMCCNAKFINLHYSLLPAFGGVIGFRTLTLAKEANARIIGATCHYVNEIVDAGKIISQAAIPVNWEDDFDKIGNSIFRIACEIFLNALLVIYDIRLNCSSSYSSVLYSPELRYDNSIFDEEFWNKINNL